MDRLGHKFKKEHPDEWAKFGCGPGGFGDYLVPDTMWGLDISEVCKIHDWYYRFYPDRGNVSRMVADDIMLDNARKIVKSKSSWFLKFHRLVRCKVYYLMVSKFGQSSWDQAKGIRDKGVNT